VNELPVLGLLAVLLPLRRKRELGAVAGRGPIVSDSSAASPP
jgi:hypothetical protein